LKMLTPREAVLTLVLSAVLLVWLFASDQGGDQAPPLRPSSRAPVTPGLVAVDDDETTTIAAAAAPPQLATVRQGAAAAQKFILVLSVTAITVGLFVDWYSSWRRRVQGRSAAKLVVQLADLRGSPAAGHPLGEQPDEKMLSDLLGRVHAIEAAAQALTLRLEAAQARAADTARAIRGC
jgi:hypothetical protein